MPFSIRQAEIGDAEAIYCLNRDALGYDYSLERTRIRLQAVLQTPGNLVLVAECQHRISGYIHAAKYECTYLDSLKDILALAVDEQERGHGIGRALLGAVEDWARETGSSGVRLVSGEDRTGAHQFYEACGYLLRKKQKNFLKLF